MFKQVLQNLNVQWMVENVSLLFYLLLSSFTLLYP